MTNNPQTLRGLEQQRFMSPSYYMLIIHCRGWGLLTEGLPYGMLPGVAAGGRTWYLHLGVGGGRSSHQPLNAPSLEVAKVTSSPNPLARISHMVTPTQRGGET